MTSPTADGQGWRPIDSYPEMSLAAFGWAGHDDVVVARADAGQIKNAVEPPTHWRPYRLGETLPSPPTSVEGA